MNEKQVNVQDNVQVKRNKFDVFLNVYVVVFMIVLVLGTL